MNKIIVVIIKLSLKFNVNKNTTKSNSEQFLEPIWVLKTIHYKNR